MTNQPNKPKSAEEWVSEIMRDSDGSLSKPFFDRIVKEIQLDAAKAALTRAAEECVRYKNHGDTSPPIETRKAILSLRDNLKSIEEL